MKKYISIFIFVLLSLLIKPSISNAQVIPCISAAGATVSAGMSCNLTSQSGSPNTPGTPGTSGICTIVNGEILCVGSTTPTTGTTGLTSEPATIESVSCPSPVPVSMVVNAAGQCICDTSKGFSFNAAGQCVCSPSYVVVNGQCVGLLTPVKYVRDVTVRLLVAGGTNTYVSVDGGPEASYITAADGTIILSGLTGEQHNLTVRAEGYSAPLALVVLAQAITETAPPAQAVSEAQQPNIFVRALYAILDFLGLSSWHGVQYATTTPPPSLPTPPAAHGPGTGISQVDLRVGIVINDGGTDKETKVLYSSGGVVQSVTPISPASSANNIICPKLLPGTSAIVGPILAPTTIVCSSLNASLGNIKLSTPLNTPAIPNAHFLQWTKIPGSPGFLTLPACILSGSSSNDISCVMTGSRYIQAEYKCNTGFSYDPTTKQCQSSTSVQTACGSDPLNPSNTKLTNCKVNLDVNRTNPGGLIPYTVIVSSSPSTILSPSSNPPSPNCLNSAVYAYLPANQKHCELDYTKYPTQLTFSRLPLPSGSGVIFTGWFGACTGNGLTCGPIPGPTPYIPVNVIAKYSK